MANQMIVLALIFFAVVGMASAANTAPSAAPAATPSSTPAASSPTEDVPAFGGVNSTYADSSAAPATSPVPEGAFGDVATPPAPSEAAALGVTGAIAAAGLVGSFFF